MTSTICNKFTGADDHDRCARCGRKHWGASPARPIRQGLSLDAVRADATSRWARLLALVPGMTMADVFAGYNAHTAKVIAAKAALA